MASIRCASDAIGDVTVVPPDSCSPCQIKYGTTSRVAGWYCIDCEEFICNDCKDSHESFKTLRQHKIVTHTQGVERKEILTELAELETCRVHNEKKLEFFCLSHTTFCCSVCIAEMHKKCGTTPQILQRNRDKIIESSPDVLTVFTGLQERMADILKQFVSNRKNLEKLIFDLPDIFKSLRQDISDLLDEAEQKLQRELQDMIKMEEKETSDFKTRISSAEKDLHRAVKLFKGSWDYGTEKHNIILEYQMKARSKKYKDEITAVKGVAHRVDISVSLNPNFVQLLQNPYNIFGVFIERTQNAKFMSTVLSKSDKDKKEPWITGTTFLADDRLVLADNRNKNVKLYNRDLTYDSELVLESSTWDVTAYNKDKVAITFRDKREFLLLSVKQKISPLQAISVPYDCRGICGLGNDRFVLTAAPGIVLIVDIHGKEMSRLTFEKGYLNNPMKVALNAIKAVAYVCSYSNHKLCAVDMKSKKILFTYQHDDLKLPRGVTVDKDGNVFVCGEDSQNVHQISAKGKLIKILLSQNDRVKSPSAVCFSNDGRGLLVSDLADNVTERVKIYDME